MIGAALVVTGAVLYTLGTRTQLYTPAGLVIVLALAATRENNLTKRRGLALLVAVLATGLVVGLLLADH